MIITSDRDRCASPRSGSAAAAVLDSRDVAAVSMCWSAGLRSKRLAKKPPKTGQVKRKSVCLLWRLNQPAFTMVEVWLWVTEWDCQTRNAKALSLTLKRTLKKRFEPLGCGSHQKRVTPCRPTADRWSRDTTQGRDQLVLLPSLCPSAGGRQLVARRRCQSQWWWTGSVRRMPRKVLLAKMYYRRSTQLASTPPRWTSSSLFRLWTIFWRPKIPRSRRKWEQSPPRYLSVLRSITALRLHRRAPIRTPCSLATTDIFSLKNADEPSRFTR